MMNVFHYIKHNLASSFVDGDFLVSEYDSFQSLDSTPSPLTRDFIGLCIGILSVVLVILIVAICKWSRCLCLKRNNDQNEDLSSVIQTNTSSSHSHARRHHHHQQRRSSSCEHLGDVHRYTSSTRDGLLSPPQPTYNGHRSNGVKVPRVTITTLPAQPSQQLVPRLSISPQVSSSSITRSTYSMKQ